MGKILVSFLDCLLLETNHHVWGMGQALYLELFMICIIIPILKSQRTNVTGDPRFEYKSARLHSPYSADTWGSVSWPTDFSRAPTDPHASVSYICVLVVFLCSVFSKTKQSAPNMAQLLFQSMGSLYFWGQLLTNRGQQLVCKHTCVSTLQ